MSDSKDVVRYVASDHMTRWKAFSMKGLRNSRVAGISTATSFVVSGIFSGILMAGSQNALFSSIAFAVTMSLCFFLFLPLFSRDYDARVVNDARDRVQAFATNHFPGKPSMVISELYMRLGDDQMHLPETRSFLLHLDALLLRRLDAVAEIGPDPEQIAEADAITRKAFLQVVEQYRAATAARNDGRMTLDRLRHDVDAIASGTASPAGLPSPTAPTARISRIVETAERLLASHPDAVDAQGARVADLVRQHVPRLLHVHADAARAATSDRIAEVDAALDRGVDDVRASVEEAIGLLQDETMDVLATELRFLKLRRGGSPLLSTVA